MNSSGYIYETGSFIPKASSPDLSIINLNCCMMPGPLPLLYGGVTPASCRLGDLAQFIKTHDPDIVCLQEMCGKAAIDLARELKQSYSHIFYHMNKDSFPLESGLFVATKKKIAEKPQFIPFHVPNMQKGICRGYFILILEDVIIISTHLQPKGTIEDQRIRDDELDQIEESIENCKRHYHGKPIILCGDLNIAREGAEKEDEYSKSIAQRNFFDPVLQKHPYVTKEVASQLGVQDAHDTTKKNKNPTF